MSQSRIPPATSATWSLRFGAWFSEFSFVSERLHRIHFRRTPRRQVTSEQCDSREEQRDHDDFHQGRLRFVEAHAFTDRLLLTAVETPRRGLIDDHDGRRFAVVALGKLAPEQERRAHRLKIFWPDRSLRIG